MKKLIIAVTVILAMASCKKENSMPNPVPTPAVEKKLVRDAFGGINETPSITNYTYDAQGKISSIVNDSWTFTFDFATRNSLVITARKTADNSFQGTDECTLNDKGYVVKIVSRNKAGAVVRQTDYMYNTDGNIINKKWSDAAGNDIEHVYTVTNGNMVSYQTFSHGNPGWKYQYSYDNSKMNKAQAYYTGEWAVKNLFGKGSVNLVKEIKALDATGNVTWHTEYNFETDAEGYPVKEASKNVSSGLQFVKTYTFQ